jgi:hypothetical protein
MDSIGGIAIFRQILKKNRDAGESCAEDIMEKGTHGVLSTTGEDGYPYGVPLSYVFSEGAIYFHCAKQGHKIDNMMFSDKVSFCMVESAETIPEKFTTRYKSAIAFGAVTGLFGDSKKKGLYGLVEKYSGSHIKRCWEYIEMEAENARVFKMEVSHLTGKQRT